MEPGSNPSKVITLLGEGFVDYRNTSRKGNMYVKLVLQVPKDLTDKQKQLLKDFERDLYQSRNSGK